jgi:hypothetical protein
MTTGVGENCLGGLPTMAGRGLIRLGTEEAMADFHFLRARGSSKSHCSGQHGDLVRCRDQLDLGAILEVLR